MPLKRLLHLLAAVDQWHQALTAAEQVYPSPAAQRLGRRPRAHRHRLHSPASGVDPPGRQRALAQARAEVERTAALPLAERPTDQLRNTVQGMVDVVPLLAPGSDLQGARLVAELREYAGQLGSHFTAALSRQQPFSPVERVAIARTRGHIDELRFLIERQIRMALTETALALQAPARDEPDAPLPRPGAEDEMAAVVSAVRSLQAHARQRDEQAHVRDQLIERLRDPSNTDSLTGLPNRRAFFPTREQGLAFADRLHEAIAAAPLSCPSGAVAHVTASVGVADTGHHGLEADHLLAQADAAMYRTKLAGRNRLAVAAASA